MIRLLNCGFFSYPKDVERGNQDSFLLPKAIQEGYVLAIADGVGSYLGAKEAADAATNIAGSLSSEILRDANKSFLYIKNAVDSITDKNSDFIKAATTFSYCFIDNNELIIGHVGDTRIYIKVGGKLIALSKDHTQHQELLDDGIYTKRELRDISGKNSLTSAISKTLPLRFQHEKIKLADLIENDGIINIYMMSDGAYHFWEKRKKFSPETLQKTPRFASSLLRRIENSNPIDDYTLVSASFKFHD
jgi:serine/threonine protein phosphatase PrpC